VALGKLMILAQSIVAQSNLPSTPTVMLFLHPRSAESTI
jgi:hypothetical protein